MTSDSEILSAGVRELPCEQVGKYALVSRIGEGGMAVVYRAHLRGPAQATREVALKVIHPHFVEQEDFILMFLDEMRVAMALSHRNIVQTFDAGEDEGRYFLVMELVDGCALGELLKRGAAPIPIEIAIFVAMELSSALEYAHTFRSSIGGQPHAVVHRDVSPSNILLSRQGDVKLADFGVAKAAGRLAVSSADLVKGKLGYMAPEQAFGQVEPSSDLFSLGAVLYRILCGRSIRAGASLDSVRLGQPVPALLSQVRPEISPGLEALIMSCLASEPSKRPASAGVLREALGRELLTLQLATGQSTDSHARLRGFLTERLAAPALPALAAEPREGARLAQLLLEQVRGSPEETGASELTVPDAPALEVPSVGEAGRRPGVAPSVAAAGEEAGSQPGAAPSVTAAGEVTRPSPALSLRRPHRVAWPILGAAAVLLVGAAVIFAIASSGDRPSEPGAPAATGGSGPPREDARRSPVPDATSLAVDPPRRDAAVDPDATVARRAPGRRRPARRPASAKAVHAARVAPGSSSLWIMTRHRGEMVWAHVYLDGRRVGQSPIHLEKLGGGAHTIEGRRDGYRPGRRSVVLAPGQTIRVFLELETAP